MLHAHCLLDAPECCGKPGYLDAFATSYATLEYDFSHVLAFESKASQLAKSSLFSRLLLGLAPLDKRLYQAQLCLFIAGGWVVVLVEVNLAEQKHILASNEKKATGDVSVKAPIPRGARG